MRGESLICGCSIHETVKLCVSLHPLPGCKAVPDRLQCRKPPPELADQELSPIFHGPVSEAFFQNQSHFGDFPDRLDRCLRDKYPPPGDDSHQTLQFETCERLTDWSSAHSKF